jgi:hypothetical protein
MFSTFLSCLFQDLQDTFNKKNNVSESAYRELTVLCEGYHENIWLPNAGKILTIYINKSLIFFLSSSDKSLKSTLTVCPSNVNYDEDD